MKNTLISLLLLLSFHSSAQEDCSLNPEAIKGVLKGAQTKREKHGVTETLTLKNGVKITYQMGGCAHYAYSFMFENFGKEKLTDRTVILALAAKLLNDTPVIETANRDRLLNSIKEAGQTKEKLEDHELQIPCGDANCAIDLREEGKLKVGYDFAL
ncbi:MAG: hypothetical protein V4598_05285 [Bdellovibrionota bacterium]